MKFVLIHGAWLDKSCWAKTASILETKGHQIVAFDLAGHGDDSTPLAEITLDRYVSQAVAAAESLGGEVTLVGHSMAGIVVSSTLEARPDLFIKGVYIAAYLVGDGQSLNDLAQTDADSHVGPNLRPAADWSTLDIAEEARKGLFFPDVADELSAPLLANWKAEPVGPQVAPLKLTDERFGSVPRLYVHTAKDIVVSRPLQGRMVEAVGAATVEIETGHLPMLADPVALSNLLEA